MIEYDDYLDAIDDEAPTKERFIIDDEAKAAWVVDKMMQYQEKLARLKYQYTSMVTQIANERDSFKQRFEPQLAEWFHENQPKRGKSLKLLTGTIGFRTIKGGPRVVNDDEFLTWARTQSNGDKLIRVIEEVDRKAAADWVNTTGEIPPGVIITDDAERFYVTGPKEAQNET